MTVRTKILEGLIKEAELNKTAQEVVDTVTSNVTSSDTEFANQIFNELLKRLKIEGLE